VMLDNLTYFWSTSAPFFWVFLNAYMVFTGGLPFEYEITPWMMWLLSIKVLQYILTYIMKSNVKCTELAMWRSQQMFFVTAPMHQLSIINGTKSAYSIIRRGADESFWDTDNSDQVLLVVKMWLTFIISAATVSVLGVATASLYSRLSIKTSLITSSMWAATLILVLMAFCVFDAFLDVWDLSTKVSKVSDVHWAGKKPDSGRWSYFGWFCCRGWSRFCRFFLSVRRRMWIIRWFMDLGLPVIVLFLDNSQSLALAAAFSMLVRL